MPLAVFAEDSGGVFHVSGMVGMPDGSRLLRASASGRPVQAIELADSVARDLIGQGADRIIAALGR